MNPNNSSPRGQSLLSTGFNAHGQLGDRRPAHLKGFQPIAQQHEISRVLYTGWSSTVLLTTQSDVLNYGYAASQGASSHQHNSHEDHSSSSTQQPAENFIDAFGNEDGMIGYLDAAEGELHLARTRTDLRVFEPKLKPQASDLSPSVGHIAMSGTGKIAITFKQAPNGRLCHILIFDNFNQFETWHRDPSEAKLEAEKQHFMLPGRPKQLVANIATFLLLMEEGEVYSWGDPRYRSLGRDVTGEGSVAAERPGGLLALGGLEIEKIACGGWICAALSTDGVVYVWGADMPGSSRSIRCLRDAGGGEVALVDLADGNGGSLDILDVGVGDHHIVVVAQDKRLYVVGDNTNGQLGVESDEGFLEEWTKVDAVREVTSVVCGPKSTFIFTASSS